MMSLTLGAVTGTTLSGLPQGATIAVTLSAVGATASASATLPRPATAAETAAYASATAFSDANSGEAAALDTYKLGVADTQTYAPGQAFVYDPLSFQLFALYFQARSGGIYMTGGQVSGGSDPIGYLQTKLFAPLGIVASAYTWQRDAKGSPQMAGGAAFAATDWIKYGQFALQRGTWKNSRLLPAASIDQCTGDYKNPAYLGYGISWWLNAHNKRYL